MISYCRPHGWARLITHSNEHWRQRRLRSILANGNLIADGDSVQNPRAHAASCKQPLNPRFLYVDSRWQHVICPVYTFIALNYIHLRNAQPFSTLLSVLIQFVFTCQSCVTPNSARKKTGKCDTRKH